MTLHIPSVSATDGSGRTFAFEGSPVPSEAPTLADAAGVFFLTLSLNDRTSIATTVERLINMLDDMEPDPDLEPYLADCHQGDRTDDREADYEDPFNGSVSSDYEPTLGWRDEGDQSSLMIGAADDYEADLGTTEEIDQVRRLEQAPGFMCGEDEPSLGWAESHGRGIIGEQNCLDDREAVDECEPEIDGGEEECRGESPAGIPGGGSVSQADDGWTPAPGPSRPAGFVKKKRPAKAPDTEMTERVWREPTGDIVRVYSAGDVPLIDPRWARKSAPELKAGDFARLPWA